MGSTHPDGDDFINDIGRLIELHTPYQWDTFFFMALNRPARFNAVCFRGSFILVDFEFLDCPLPVW